MRRRGGRTRRSRGGGWKKTRWSQEKDPGCPRVEGLRGEDPRCHRGELSCLPLEAWTASSRSPPAASRTTGGGSTTSWPIRPLPPVQVMGFNPRDWGFVFNSASQFTSHDQLVGMAGSFFLAWTSRGRPVGNGLNLWQLHPFVNIARIAKSCPESGRLSRCQGVFVTVWAFKFCCNLSFWVLSQLKLSFNAIFFC